MTEKEYLIATTSFIPLGPDRIRLLVEYFGSARGLWESTRKELSKVGLSGRLVASFTEHRERFNEEKYFTRLAKEGVLVVTEEDKDYPKLLKGIPSSPITLYIKGSLKGLKDTVAIVGSRKMTPYGERVAKLFSRELAKKGIAIISGLARGVDTQAHLGTLSVGGRTIAVLGCGLDRVYPPENTSLARDIIKKGGALISEYPLGYPPLAANFPARNRIISGLSKAVVVVEGRRRSGTLLIASAAAEQGRALLAVPGDITSPMSEASFFLIQNGARMATSVDDVLDEIKASTLR